jgi:hypothetical protein
MALLKSVTDVPGIDYYDYRDSEYYNKFTYRLRFKMPSIRYIINETKVDGLMKRYNATSGWRVIKAEDRPIVTENLEALKQLIELRNSVKKDGTATVRIEWNHASVFSNDLSFLKNIENIKPELEYDYTQVQTNNFVGVKSFVNDPKHKYRVYLKSKMIQNSFVTQLDELLKRSTDLHPSLSLKYWLQGYNSTAPSWSWRYRYTNCNHFIDYDDETLLSYLALMHGEFLGKRYKLEKRPEAI